MGENGVNDIEEHIAKHGGDVESISVYEGMYLKITLRLEMII